MKLLLRCIFVVYLLVARCHSQDDWTWTTSDDNDDSYAENSMNSPPSMKNHCKISGDGEVHGRVRYTHNLTSIESGCIIRIGPQQSVVPIKSGNDRVFYDQHTGVTTFHRSVLPKGKKKGRAEMCFCFSTRDDLKKFNDYQVKYLSHAKMIADFCPNSVHTTQRAVRSEYGLWMRIPKTDDNMQSTEAIVVQWHGRPRRDLYMDSDDGLHKLNVNISGIVDSRSLDAAIRQYDTVLQQGGSFNQGGYPPMAVHVTPRKLAITTRYDPRVYTDKSLRCSVDVERFPVNVVKKCGVLEETIIYRTDMDPWWWDRWRYLRFVVNWGGVGRLSKVEVFVDGEPMVVWKGLLGRNDEHGAFMKYGIYAPKNTTNFTIQFKGAHSNVYN